MAIGDEFLELAQRGDASAVESLLRTQPDLAHYAGDYGKTGLHWAAETDQVEVARILIDARADIEATTTWNATPLEWAATMGSSRVADLLLSRDAKRFTFVVAAALGKLEEVKTRVESGEDLSTEFHEELAVDDHWPADSARIQGDILSHALYSAARNGHTKVVDYLLGQGAEIDAKGVFGGTGLHWAAINGHRNTVDFLIQHGASRTIRDDRFDGTPEAWAKEGGHLQIAERLRNA
jgi:ankyrin repeat protein